MFLRCQLGNKVSEDKTKHYFFSPILVNLLSSSILQVEEQKVKGLFPTFYFIHATFCLLVICSWLILSVIFMNSFDFLFLSFPDSLEYIVCQHWKSPFVSTIIDISLTIMGARLAFAEIL